MRELDGLPFVYGKTSHVVPAELAEGARSFPAAVTAKGEGGRKQEYFRDDGVG